MSGVCLSDSGHTVVCVDKFEAKISQLNSGEVPIYEPGLGVLLAKNAAASWLSFTTSLSYAVDGAEAVFIAVGTPSRRGDGRADREEHAVPQSIVETVIRGNECVKARMVEKLRHLYDGSFNGRTVVVLGVTFKPNTDDIRDAPSLTIVLTLIDGGAAVRVVDPQGRHEDEVLFTRRRVA